MNDFLQRPFHFHSKLVSEGRAALCSQANVAPPSGRAALDGDPMFATNLYLDCNLEKGPAGP